MIDLFGNEITAQEAIHVNIYSDEVWETVHKITGENWIYSVAIYEKINNPILEDLINIRYLKDKDNWEYYKDKNDTDIHWAQLGNDANKKNVIERWIKFIHDDCFNDRKFHFSLIGINLSNLNREEFDNKQNLNSIYNRFYRSMIQFSVKKFFGKGVIIENIYHEQGSQEDHGYFNWHTIYTLDKDEYLNFNCREVIFLPKSHRYDTRSNILQLCDVLAGILKDLHCGIEESKKNKNKREILDSKIVKDLFIDRIIKKPNNINSGYGYAKRFHISFFPKFRSDYRSIVRSFNNYYDVSNIELAFESNINQKRLF